MENSLTTRNTPFWFACQLTHQGRETHPWLFEFDINFQKGKSCIMHLWLIITFWNIYWYITPNWCCHRCQVAKKKLQNYQDDNVAARIGIQDLSAIKGMCNRVNIKGQTLVIAYLWLAMRWRMATMPGTQQMRMTATPAILVSHLSSLFSGSSMIM